MPAKRRRSAAIWNWLVTSTISISTCAGCRSASSWSAVLPVSRTVAVTYPADLNPRLCQCQTEPARSSDEKDSSGRTLRLIFGWVFSYCQ